MRLGVSACLIGTPCRYDGVGASDTPSFISNPFYLILW